MLLLYNDYDTILIIYFSKLSASYQTDINKIFNEPKKQSTPVPSTDQNNKLNREDDILY